MKKIMLSAMQPSNELTLGNYLGALKHWVHFQEQHDCLFFVVDLHALTIPKPPEVFKKQVYSAVAWYLATGIDPEKSTLFIQSHVSEHTELAWVFHCFLSMGELSRMTQFKEKSEKEKTASVGLFTYPALMAADILLYQTQLVPVGEDQRQHIELTRDIAHRMNQLSQRPLFTLPEPWHPAIGARIMSLQNPEMKMSKSDPDPYGSIFLLDEEEMILKKVKKAKTDSQSEITPPPHAPGIANLIAMHAACAEKTPEDILSEYLGKPYGYFKIQTAQRIAAKLKPIQEKMYRLLENRDYLDTLLKQGAQKAQKRAKMTLHEVFDRLGILRKT
jgi:tryptophanyl-tRNA synthetase